MRTTLITSTAEATGKTAMSVALAQIARERGESVGYMKPKGMRVESQVGKTLDADPLLAREILGIDADVQDLEPVVYSPTFVEGALRGRENPEAIRERVREAFETLAEGRDRMILEGGGRFAAGGVVDLTDADVAQEFDANVLLLSRYSKPDDVDDVLAIADRLGDNLGGVVFNAVESAQYDQVETDVTSFLESRNVPVHGVLPRSRDMAGITVATLADELGATVLTGGTDEGLVERFLVGAMSGEAALRHFRRTKGAAVITGGDRADIHTAALQAPGVSCLVLTGGFEPPGTVLGKAEEAGVPVLVVQSDTLTTIDRAEEIIDDGRVRDERTVAKLRELLESHADLGALLDGA